MCWVAEEEEEVLNWHNSSELRGIAGVVDHIQDYAGHSYDQ
jgi:hypothetical protein